MEKELKAFGLSEKETKVYLSLMHLGPSLVQEIAKRANTYRTYTYEILKSLKEKGLVSYVIKSGKQYYEPAPPEKLTTILKEKEEQINKIMPNLLKIYTTTIEKPRIEVYEGTEGLKTILTDMIKTKKEILVYGSTKNMFSNLRHNFPKFVKNRVNANIKTKIIDRKTKESIKMHAKDNDELREMHFLPQNIKLDTITQIYGNKTALFSFDPEFIGIVIENSSIAKTQKNLFKLIWETTKQN